MGGLVGETFRLPPVHQSPQTLLDRDGGLKAQQLPGLGDISQAARNGVHLSFWPIFQRRIRSHDAQQNVREVVEAGLGAAGDVEHFVGNVRLGAAKLARAMSSAKTKSIV